MAYKYKTTRKQRGKTQKIFLVEHNPISKYVKEYVVMGTTGNIYKVKIQETPVCTCWDYMTRHRRCKHIYFILCRIMKVNQSKEDTPSFSKRALFTASKSIFESGEQYFFNNCTSNTPSRHFSTAGAKNCAFQFTILFIKSYISFVGDFFMMEPAEYKDFAIVSNLGLTKGSLRGERLLFINSPSFFYFYMLFNVLNLFKNIFNNQNG